MPISVDITEIASPDLDQPLLLRTLEVYDFVIRISNRSQDELDRLHRDKERFLHSPLFSRYPDYLRQLEQLINNLAQLRDTCDRLVTAASFSVNQLPRFPLGYANPYDHLCARHEGRPTPLRAPRVDPQIPTSEELFGYDTDQTEDLF